MVAVIVVDIFALCHKMNRVIRTNIQIEITVILQMRILVAEQRVQRHIDALARAHTVGGDGETGALVLPVRLETDGQTARRVIHGGGIRQCGRRDGIGDTVCQSDQQRVVDRGTIVDEQRVRTIDIERRQIEVHSHRVVIRVVGTDGHVVVHVWAVIPVKTAVVIDGHGAPVHGGLRAHTQGNDLGVHGKHSAQ